MSFAFLQVLVLFFVSFLPCPNVLAGLLVGVASGSMWMALKMVPVWAVIWCFRVNVFESDRATFTIATIRERAQRGVIFGSPWLTFYAIEAATAYVTALFFALPLAVLISMTSGGAPVDGKMLMPAAISTAAPSIKSHHVPWPEEAKLAYASRVAESLESQGVSHEKAMIAARCVSDGMDAEFGMEEYTAMMDAQPNPNGSPVDRRLFRVFSQCTKGLSR